MYCRFNGHHGMDEFIHPPQKDELVVYTWKDASLSELAGLIKEVVEGARRKEIVFSFRLVFKEVESKKYYSFKELGRVANSHAGRDDHVTLSDCSFIIGDYIDVAMFEDGGRERHCTGSGISRDRR
jgi:histone deacetylase complex subunit SAP18